MPGARWLRISVRIERMINGTTSTSNADTASTERAGTDAVDFVFANYRLIEDGLRIHRRRGFLL